MEISGPNNRPFIIRRNQNRTLLPPESPNFDEKVENYVRFVQGANAFIAVNYLYFSINLVYSFSRSTRPSESSIYILYIKTNAQTILTF